MLELLEPHLAVCRLPANTEPSLPGGVFASLTRTAEELSLVCEERFAPVGARLERGWRALKVAGPLEFSQVGVLVSLATPLAEAGLSVFVVSTFDTDYLLVKDAGLERAVAALQEAGHALA